LEFIDSVLAHYKYLVPVAEHLEGGVRGPNPTQGELEAANEWLGSTFLSSGHNLADYLRQIVSLGK
jgi:hypothetical protein